MSGTVLAAYSAPCMIPFCRRFMPIARCQVVSDRLPKATVSGLENPKSVVLFDKK